MSAAHTPGPWRWVNGDGWHRELIRAQGEMGDYDSIAYHGADWPMTDADARLIAAAPALLEALRLIDQWIITEFIHSRRSVLLEQMRERARAALSAAQGGGHE